MITLMRVSREVSHKFVLGARKAESDKIREKYPDRIPVICEKSATSKLPDIDKSK